MKTLRLSLSCLALGVLSSCVGPIPSAPPSGYASASYSQPSYREPANYRREYSEPPTYSPPPSYRAPSYSPPPPSYSAPAPSYSGPAPYPSAVRDVPPEYVEPARNVGLELDE